MSHDPSEEILLQDSRGDASRWLSFRRPRRTWAAYRIEDVIPVLEEVEAAVTAGGWAVGCLAYEAAPALDPALVSHPTGRFPLTWWQLFDAPAVVPPPTAPTASPKLDWRPAVPRSAYLATIARIRTRIAEGDTYQTNFTFPLEARLDGDPKELFAALCHAQQASYCAYLETVGSDGGRFAVCSASPELFFRLDGDHVVTRPMKGTARRGRHELEDRQHAKALAISSKDRAENVMIVDMLRNDLGKVAHPGSVRVDELFQVETYPTVHQLTSTVSARTDASIVELLQALFPCASITGAPKVSTAAILRHLEGCPRGLYTGSIGFLAPGRQAQFNVAIRTAVVDRESGRATYGTGGGIVWDSEPTAEYDECRAKALVLTAAPPPFRLLETLLWRPLAGYYLLDRHLARLESSARYFRIPVDVEEARRRLLEAVDTFAGFRHRVRLLVDTDGRAEAESQPWPSSEPAGWRICLDDRPIDSRDRFLFHKTTHRQVYDQARQRFPEVDEVVLWNERGELTETTRANLVLEIDGEWWTPPVDCGLLAGTYRAELLERGRIRERVLPISQLEAADQVILVNSVRGWMPARRERDQDTVLPTAALPTARVGSDQSAAG